MKENEIIEVIPSSSDHEKWEESQGKKRGIIPAAEWRPYLASWMLIETEHPFLKEILRISKQQKDTWVLYSYDVLFITQFVDQLPVSTAVIYIYNDHVLLDYIVTKKEERNKGLAGKLMKIITEAAKATKTTLRLEIGENGFGLFSEWLQIRVVSQGGETEGQIPEEKLPEWFAEFGFLKSPSGNQAPIQMYYYPQ